ncbi:hypothetical protein ONZ45_g10513 [Pleurotus djamor]|nr:hypothetical protein ONZ45_g10513 [Pleurotus djamor]
MVGMVPNEVLVEESLYFAAHGCYEIMSLKEWTIATAGTYMLSSGFDVQGLNVNEIGHLDFNLNAHRQFFCLVLGEKRRKTKIIIAASSFYWRDLAPVGDALGPRLVLALLLL